jgi:hypothetical protein
LVELQVNSEVPPTATELGFAVRTAVGAGVGWTVTVVVAAGLVPPGPLQVSVKSVVTVSAPVLCVPAVASAPLQPPEAAQAVACVELQVSVAVPAPTKLAGEAASNAVGTSRVGGGVVCCDEPPPQAARISAVDTSRGVKRGCMGILGTLDRC